MQNGTFNMRDRAIALAQDGFRVFRLKANGRTPAVVDWPNVATNDIKAIRHAWTDPVSGEPLHDNIGIATGPDFFVLDVDVKHGKRGAESLEALIDRGLSIDTRATVTPSGGQHYFYALPERTRVRNTASKLGDGLDTRGDGGYVVAPGSSTDDGEYAWLNDAEMIEPPQWLLDLITQSASSHSDPRTPLVDPDSEAAIRRAIDWLASSAPPAIEGAGGNSQTFAIAARVKDFGVSAPTCLDLMLHHWNDDKALPPWRPDELHRVIENAYRYGQEPLGRSSAEADFAPVDIESRPFPQATPFEKFSLSTLPKRRWVIDGFAVRTFVSGIVSPGGMGKTQLVANIALAVATNNSDMLGLTIAEQTRVWYWNQEDDTDELKRRFAAAMQHHDITWPAIGDRIRLNSGVEKPLILVKRTSDGRITENRKVVDTLINEIRATNIGLFVFDPLVEFHEANENDNVEMRVVMAAARRIAVSADCAVIAVAHTRKPPGASAEGFAGDMDALRGAGAQANVMRLMHTLFGMTVKDAKAHGIPADKRHLYVRLDMAKANLALVDGKALWLRRVSVRLGGDDGESIGVLEPARLSSRSAETDVMHTFAAAMARGMQRGTWHALADVAAAMNEAELDALGPRSNWQRVLSKGAQTHRADLNGPTPAEIVTDFGTLRVINRRGRAGIQFSLSDTDDCPLVSAAVRRKNTDNCPQTHDSSTTVRDEQTS